MDKYNNELEACAKLKPGFGEFYGGNQIHITWQNDKQLEKNKYKPFEGTGNLLIKNSPNTRQYKTSPSIKQNTKNTLSPKRTYTTVETNTIESNTVESNIYTKINSFDRKKESNYNRRYRSNVNTIKTPVINYTNSEIDSDKQKFKSDNNGICVFLIILFIFYIYYLLYLANQKLYYYTGYKF